MNHYKKSLLTITCLSMMLLMTQCKKDGCTDASASNYNSEAKKDNGTCVYDDLISSDEIIISWTQQGNEYYFGYNYPAITQAVIDHGYVLSYISFQSDRWYQLPYSYADQSSGGVVTILSEYFEGGGYLYLSSDVGISNPGGGTLRIVAVEDRSTLEGVDLSNYNEVRKRINR